MSYVDVQVQGFKVNLKLEKKSKFSSVVSKIRGLDQVALINFLSLSLSLFLSLSLSLSLSAVDIIMKIKKVR